MVEHERFDPHGPGREVELFALAHAGIGPLAIHVHGGHLGGALLDQASKVR